MKNAYSVLIVCLSLISFSSMSQISVGINGGIVKSTEENSESLLGGELVVKYDVREQIRAGVNLGFYQKSDEVFGVKYATNFMPISISGEYLFLESDFRPYVGLHIGGLRSGVKVGNSSSSEFYFALSPVVGADYQINENIGINLNFKYGFAFYNNDLTDELDNFSTISPNIGVFYKL